MSAPAAPHERLQGAGPLAGHPQRQLVIDAILKGEVSTSIKRWVKPPVSHVTICKLAKLVKEQAAVARTVEQVARIESIALNSAVKGKSADELTRLATMGSEHLARIRKHQERIDAAMEDVEPETLATLIKTDFQGIRLAAELDGSLAAASPASTTNNYSVVLLPRVLEPSEEGETIDVQAEPL